METQKKSSKKFDWWDLVSAESPLWLPFCLFCIFISPFLGILYIFYYWIYIVIYSQEAWEKKMDAEALERHNRCQKLREEQKF